MASKTLTLVIQPRGKPIKGLPEETTITNLDSSAELYKRIAAAAGCSVHRLKITKGSDGSSIPNTKDVSVDRTGLRDRSKIIVKELGPQISWRTVFIVEYFGPIFIHTIFYFLRQPIYGTSSAPSEVQTLSYALICTHFLKREFETVFVHRFSLATMPAFNIVKNSAHYWVLSGLLIAYFSYAPSAPSAGPKNAFTNVGLGLFAVGELFNFLSHLTLRNLRKPGSTERGIPRGFDFDLVTCPNYMWETVAWVGMFLVNRSWTTVVFAVVAVAQMAVWAKKKERRYRKEFGDKYKKKRFSILPGIY